MRVVNRRTGWPAASSAASRSVVWRVTVGGDGHKDTIGAVLVRTAQRFVDDRERALAVFAGAFGDELFDPETERCQ